MGKPLLTDEIIERANRGEIFYDDNYLEDEETKVIRTDQYDTLTSYDPYEEYEDFMTPLCHMKKRKKKPKDFWINGKIVRKKTNTFIKVVALKMLNVASFNENLI